MSTIQEQATSNTRRRRPRRRGPKKNLPSSSSSNAEETLRVCPYFRKGFCRLGTECPLLHEVVAASSTGSSPLPIAASSASSSNSSDCPICFETFPSSRLCSISTCKSHRYCRGCLRSHFVTHISSNELHRVVCPHPDCAALPTDKDLRRLLTAKQFQSFERFSVLSACRDAKTLWCPFPTCGALCLADGGCSIRAACPSCQGVICLACNRPDHPGVDCRSNESDEKFAQWTKNQGQKVKLCPSCLQQVAKTDGCNHMTVRLHSSSLTPPSSFLNSC